MDLTVATADLAAAATDLTRLLPARVLDPVLAGVLLRADPAGVTLAATDRERAARLRCPALTHTDGAVLVPGRPLAETLRALDEPEVRLVVEGNRLAVRTPRSRFGLPLLDVDLHPGVAAPPAMAGRAGGAPLLRALAAVAGAASKDEALPLFTGVRIRAQAGGRLRLVATDRYRLGIAELPWTPAEPSAPTDPTAPSTPAEPTVPTVPTATVLPAAGGLDVLVPAGLATELARQAAGSAAVDLHADADRFALAWGDSVVATALLASPFPDEERYLTDDADATAQLSADALAGAVRRVALFADGRGAVEVELADGEVRVRGGSPELGDGEETVKATVTGRLRQTYRVRYLQDALRVFSDEPVLLRVRAGMRTTAFTAPESTPDGLRLRHLVMPILPRN